MEPGRLGFLFKGNVLNKKLRSKYTTLDFKDHELIITKTDGILIHHLKKPNTITHNIKFINTNGVCVVTGDYKNWVFCREFHPSKDGYVSSHYWCEKLQISSSQEPYEFDDKATKKEITEMLKDSEDFENEEKKEEYIEYLNECFDYCDSQEWEYVSFAYNNMPSFMDAESVPNCRSIKHSLLFIFDAFNEICNRLDK